MEVPADVPKTEGEVYPKGTLQAASTKAATTPVQARAMLRRL